MKVIENNKQQMVREVARPREQMLETAIARLATTIQSAGDGVIVTDVQGRVEFLNRTAEFLLGIQSTAAEGRPLQHILRLEERSAGPIKGDLVELAIISESTITLGDDLILFPHSGEPKAVEGEISVRTGAGSASGTVVTFRDVTARNSHELQRREEQKMRAVGQLAGTVAHELNNLLTVIVGHSETLDELYPELTPLRSSTAAIQRAAGEIGAVTRQLLALSRREVLRPTAVNLNTLVEQSIPKLKSLLTAETELVISLEPQLGTVLVDPAQMDQALLDLVRHARDRMAADGKIELTTANVVVDENCRAHHLRRYVQLAIRDSGPSLKAVAIEKLFEPSWNGDPGRPSGLGLFTIKNVISAANGHFSVHSESGVGAKFVLLFPQAEQEISVTPAKATEGKSQPTVLLVEDDDAIRILLRNSLEKRAYHVIEARDGAEALLQADLHEKPIHLLITDVVMPFMDGPTLVRNLAIQRPNTKILLISGCPNEVADIQELVQHGAHFVQKPFSQRELLTRVEAILSDEKFGAAEHA